MPLILGTNSIKDTGYDVANSARFDAGSSEYIQRTYGTPTNAKIFGLSWWIKMSGDPVLGTGEFDLWGERTDTSNRVFMSINSSGVFDFFEKNGGSNVLELKTNRQFRDNGAWYHFLLLGDSTQATSNNRVKLFVNGSQITSFSTETYPSQNYDFRLAVNSTKYFGRIGLGGSLSSNYFDGYLAEAVFVDGTVTTHTDYGEFDDSGIWKPIDVSGLTFGNNGFYLDFENSGSLGADVSGNGNNFTVNNLTSVDQSTDTCTNNFITWSALTPRSSDITLSQGNCDVTMGGISRGIFATIGVSSGKWYYEAKWVSGSFFQTGVVATDTMNDNDDVYSGKTGAFMYDQAGNIKSGGSTLASVNSLSTGDIVGVYLDLDNSKLYFAKNGTIQNSGTGIDISAYSEYTFGCAPTSAVLSGNFGNPTFSITSGNTDPNGYGNFEYSTNDGGSASFDSTAKDFYALNTKNLAEYG
jgi:hypothetical protein